MGQIAPDRIGFTRHGAGASIHVNVRRIAVVLSALFVVTACQAFLPEELAPRQPLRVFVENASDTSPQIWLVDYDWQWAADSDRTSQHFCGRGHHRRGSIARS